MSKTVCIDCDRKELRIAVGTSGITGASIDHILRTSLDLEPGEELLESPKTVAAAQMLLRQANVKSGTAVVCVGRSSIELRSFQVPSVDKNELPDIVRFSAQRHFANMGDNWPIDFVILKSQDGMSNVLAASINPARIDRVSKLLESCGLKLGQLVLRPMVLCSAALAKRPELASAQTMFVDLLEEEADMVIADGGVAVFMRTIRFDSHQDDESRTRTLSSEIKRTLLAAASQQSLVNVERVLILGSEKETRGLCATLSQTIDAKVEGLDPFEFVDVTTRAKQDANHEHGRFAAAVGGILAPNQTSNLIDFRNPRKREEKKAPVRTYALAGSLAALLLGSGLYWYLSTHWELDSQISDLNEKIKKNKSIVDAANKNTSQWNKVETFLAGKYSLLEEFEYLSKNALEPEKVIYKDTSFTLDQKKNQALISTRYITPDQGNKSEAESRLRSEGRTVSSTGFTKVPDKNSKYTWVADLTMQIEPRKVEDVRKWKTIEPVDKKSASSQETEAKQDANDDNVPPNPLPIEKDSNESQEQVGGAAS